MDIQCLQKMAVNGYGREEELVFTQTAIPNGIIKLVLKKF